MNSVPASVSGMYPEAYEIFLPDRHFVYLLVDPRDDTIKYVGKTNTPQSRLQCHISEARTAGDGPGQTDKGRWLLNLAALGMAPRMFIVGAGDREWALQEERRLMKAHHEVSGLINPELLKWNATRL